MNLLDRAKLALNIVFKQNSRNRIVSLLPNEYETQMGRWEPFDFTKQVDANLSFVYTCNTLIADRSAAVGLRLFYFQGEKKVEVKKHIFLELMKNVNPYMNEYELRNFISQSLNLTGNCFLYLVRNKLNVPSEIWPVLPQNMRVVPGKQEFIKGYLYRNNGQDVAFTTDEIIHLKTVSLKDVYYGMSPVEAASYAIDLNENMKSHSISVFKNQALPSGMLSINSTYDEDSEKRIREAYDRAYKGTKKAGKTMIIWGDSKYTPLSITPRDLDFINGQKLSREEIFSMFKVPLSLIVTEQVNRSNMETSEYTFAKNVIQPQLKLISQKLNEQLLPMYDEKLFIEFDNPVPQFFEDVIAERTANLNSGFSNINEEREKAGRDAVDWGNRPFIPFNLMPYGSETEQEEEESEEEIEPEKAKIKELTQEKKDNFWNSIIKAQQPIERAMRIEMERFFEGQKNRVIDNLQEGKKAIQEKISAKDIFDFNEEKARLTKAGKPYIRSAMDIGAKNTIDMFGFDIDWNLQIPRVAEWIGIRAEKFSDWANETTLGNLRSILSQGEEAGEGIPELSKRIREFFDGVIENRSEMIARTETITASNQGNLEVYREAGVDRKEWLAEPDACEFCLELQKGGAIGINEDFVSSSPDFDEVESPSLHPNCRCSVLPVTE